MSILNSNDLDELYVVSDLLELLIDLDINASTDALYDLEEEITEEFARCCNSRIKYCECDRVRSMRP